MTELVDDQFYKILHKKYKELLLDFVLLQFDGTYLKETSHKEAVIEAISVFNSRLRVGNSLKHQKFYVEEDKMKCKKSSIEELLLDDNDDRIKTFETTGYRETPIEISYWQAFSDPPYNTNYTKEDFRKLNYLLFPIPFRVDLEVYRWNDEFSNYFDDGKEWWGTGFWSIYDKHINRFVIIGASLTD